MSDKEFDLRELVVYPDYVEGVVTQLIRISNTGLVTNYSLPGNTYGSYIDFVRQFGVEPLEKAGEVSLKATKSFDGLNVSGVDVVLTEELEPVVIELNAFHETVTAMWSI